MKGDQPHEHAAQQLRAALTKEGRMVAGVGADVWSEPLRLLFKAEKNAAKVLEWFCRHCSKDDGNEYGLPGITNGKQFRARFDWIEQKWMAATGKAGRSGDRRPKVTDIWAGEAEYLKPEEMW